MHGIEMLWTKIQLLQMKTVQVLAFNLCEAASVVLTPTGNAQVWGQFSQVHY